MSEFERDQELEIMEEKEEAVEELSLWERLKYLIIEPSRTMRYLAEKPKVLFPILAIVVGFFLLMLPRKELILQFTKDQTLQKMAEAGSPMMDLPDNMLSFAVWTVILGAAFGPLLILLIKSLFTLILGKAVDGQGKFKAILSVLSFSYLVNVIGEVVRTVISMITQNFLVVTSPAALMSADQMGKPLYTLLASFDVFAIWYLILATIGVQYVHKISMKKSGMIVFGTWAVMIAVSISMTLIRG
ncbi:MAG: Yip1 family protein [Bacillota bacterium]